LTLSLPCIRAWIYRNGTERTEKFFLLLFLSRKSREKEVVPMLDRTVYFSRDPAFKTPFGAVTPGQEVTFTLRPHVWEGFTRCRLRVREEFAGQDRELTLSLTGTEGDRSVFRGVYTAPAQPDLVWYSFRFDRSANSSVGLGREGYTGEREPEAFQLTVYEANDTPDWFGRGVTYQIFPDRFCRVSVPDPKGLVGDRIVHQNWNELMEYLPDEAGEIRNRDFFGGSLRGVLSKLDYLAELGVTTLYFCPIFESASNHRYDTADYGKIDPMLGTEEDFQALCQAAHRRGMRVMLDGVFNHTGSNSRYFNAKGFYPTVGAAQSTRSPYYNWYTFQSWPDRYDAWWGISTLPAVNEDQPSYRQYIIEDHDSIVRRWLRLGADAWRLDVADELPDDFIAAIRSAVREEKPDGFLLGEVWEDGSNKIAYSKRRRYLLGRETHGLMNYPFRSAALSYLGGGSGRDFMEAMENLRENYPRDAYYSAMNMLGTHDNPRILTILGARPGGPLETRTQRAFYRMSSEERERGIRLLMAGAILLYCFPGSPTVFYGDEAGMEGFEDPFNRGPFPWDSIDPALLRHYRILGRLRSTLVCLQKGDITYLYAQGQGLAFARVYGDEMAVATLNSGQEPIDMTLPWSRPIAVDPIYKQKFVARDGKLRITVPPEDGMLLI